MPLAAVSNLAFGKIHRVALRNISALHITGFDYVADISWTNAESQNHFVEVTLSAPEGLGAGIDSVLSLPRGATRADFTPMCKLLAEEALNAKTVTVTVRVKSASESSPPTTTTRTFALGDASTFVTDLAYNATTGVLTVPTLSYAEVEVVDVRKVREEYGFLLNTVWQYGRLNFAPLGVSGIINRPFSESSSNSGRMVSRLPEVLGSRITRSVDLLPSNALRRTMEALIAPPDVELGSSFLARDLRLAEAGSGRVIVAEALEDGQFYSATAIIKVPQFPFRQQIVGGGMVFFAKSTTEITQSLTFEYYKRGVPPVAVPVITSPTSISSLVGVRLNYEITASNRPTSFTVAGLPAGLTLTSFPGGPDGGSLWRISGVISSAGTRTFTISATNSGGTGSATITLVTTAPIPVFRNTPMALDTYVDNPFSYRIETDDARAAISVAFGTTAGMSFSAATNTITGSIAAAGTYNFTVTATNSFGTATATFTARIRAFMAGGGSISVLRNTRVRQALTASHRATWAIVSGAPSGFDIEYVPAIFGTATGPDSAFLVGTPVVAGSYGINLLATRSGTSQTSATVLTVAVTDAPLPATTINGNADIIRGGLTVERDSNVSLAFTSVPSPAQWEAAGLPPGLTHENGIISGSPSALGLFSVSLSATAEGYSKGSVGIRITVVEPPTPPPPPPAPTGTTPETRSPWILQQWLLTDLSIYARTRAVQSSFFNKDGALNLKLGDAVSFAVMFVDHNNAVFAMAPTMLRLTIRKEDNLDDLVIFKSASPPESAVESAQTYYLLPVTTGNRERDVVLEWAEANKKNEPLKCVADLDWVKDGKTYSSKTFPVLLDLDVTRP